MFSMYQKRPRDSQRAKVYDFHRDFPVERTLGEWETASLIAKVFDDHDLLVPSIKIFPVKYTSSSWRTRHKAHYSTSDHQIMITLAMTYPHYILHECAHGLIHLWTEKDRSIEVHGGLFMAVMLDLLEKYGNYNRRFIDGLAFARKIRVSRVKTQVMYPRITQIEKAAANL